MCCKLDKFTPVQTLKVFLCQVRGSCVVHEGNVAWPAPAPENIPQPVAPKPTSTEVAVEKESPLNTKMKEVALTTTGKFNSFEKKILILCVYFTEWFNIFCICLLNFADLLNLLVNLILIQNFSTCSTWRACRYWNTFSYSGSYPNDHNLWDKYHRGVPHSMGCRPSLAFAPDVCYECHFGINCSWRTLPDGGWIFTHQCTPGNLKKIWIKK